MVCCALLGRADDTRVQVLNACYCYSLVSFYTYVDTLSHGVIGHEVTRQIWKQSTQCGMSESKA